MPDRRESRFALEALFLVALAVAVTVAELRPLLIAGVMALGWVLTAGVEWAAWRDQPHYASGLPPRWYVPRVDLPPAQPLESVVGGYPEGRRDEAPTWIASAALREEVLGDWPHAAAEGPWTEVALPPRPEEPAQADPEPERERVDEAEPALDDSGAEQQGQPVEQPEQPEDRLDSELARSARRVARYSLEPLAETPRRRFGRGPEPPPTIEVAARPEGPRRLPTDPARGA